MFTQGQNSGDSHIFNDVESRIMAMLTLMNGQLAKIDPISSEIAGINGGLAQLSIKLEGAIAEIRAENINTQREVDSLKTELEKIRLKMSNMEADSKRANVIFYNFDPSRRAQTLLEDVVATFNQFIPNASIHLSDIKDVFRIKCNQNPRPILVKFTSPFCCDFVLKSGQHFRHAKIWITPDYTTRELLARKKMKFTLEAAKSAGKEAKLRGMKLFVEEQGLYTISKLMR